MSFDCGRNPEYLDSNPGPFCCLSAEGSWVFRYNPELERQFSEGVFSVKSRSMIIITLQS